MGCVGTPITSRSCTTPTIPTCTYSYGDWGVCVNGTRIRSETNNGPTGCTGGIRQNTSTTDGCPAGGDTFIPQPTASLTASPSPIIISSKASTTLIWTSTNANSCSIAGPSVTWNNISPLNGNRITPVFTTTGPKVYTLTCYGADGVSTTSTATVQVSECPTNRQQEVCNYGLCQSEGKKYGPCETTCLDTGEKIPLLDRDGSDDCIFPTTIFIECSPEGNFIKDVQNNWLIQFPSGYNSPVITEINITHGQETVSGNKIMIPKIYTSTGEKTFEATITAIDKDSITYTGTCTATTTVSGGGGGTGQ